MSEMVERVARAIYDELYKNSLDSMSHEKDWEEMRPQFLGEARAAIEAMREPTAKMLEDELDRMAGKKAEIERLREALTNIRSSHVGYSWLGGGDAATKIMSQMNREIQRMDKLARAALQPTGKAE